MQLRLADYVIEFLAQRGVSDIFTVSGGGIMFLTDALGLNKKVNYFCNYHEQACAVAAEAYARTRNHVGACLVTTGPGATNALSAIAGAYVDSIPVIVISGQVRREVIADYSKLRQLGPQEINIIEMARPVTKYAVNVTDPARIRLELERAWHIATTGRPGPAWVSIPLDVQSSEIDEECLSPYDPPSVSDHLLSASELEHAVRKVLERIRNAHRPVLICGNGVYLGHAEGLVSKLAEALKTPVLLTIGAMDLMDENDPFYMGKFGPVGQRRGNFALQNADLFLSLGASLSIASIGFNTKGFAPKAYKIVVNIDAAELEKPNLSPDVAIRSDVKAFIEELVRQAAAAEIFPAQRWLDACSNWKKRYPLVSPEFHDDRDHVNSYVFADILSDCLTPDDLIIAGNSLDVVSIYQSFRVKRGQRIFTNINFGAMGWDLPAAFGASVAGKDKRTILVTGDGSLQFNLQELQTVSHYRRNLKIFVLNNGGYSSIRTTQHNYFDGRLVGSDGHSGVSNPSFAGLARAFGMQYVHIANNAEIADKSLAVLATDGPVLCELNVAYGQMRSPRVSSAKRPDGTLETRPLEDMYPFLPPEEVRENMHLFD